MRAQASSSTRASPREAGALGGGLGSSSSPLGGVGLLSGQWELVETTEKGCEGFGGTFLGWSPRWRTRGWVQKRQLQGGGRGGPGACPKRVRGRPGEQQSGG